MEALILQNSLTGLWQVWVNAQPGIVCLSSHTHLPTAIQVLQRFKHQDYINPFSTLDSLFQWVTATDIKGEIPYCLPIELASTARLIDSLNGQEVGQKETRQSVAEP